MSLRSWVNFSKAAWMVASSVLASTTRKFFWLSGGLVTCCSISQSGFHYSLLVGAYANACEEHARHCVLRRISFCRLEYNVTSTLHRRSRPETACPCTRTPVSPW
jgi:hypothetical protein